MSIITNPNSDSPPGYGYGPPTNENNGYGYGEQPPEISQPSIDFWGAIVRRKFVVILLSIIGAGVAYLAYTQAEPRYESTMRLMIWNQAPPSIVNGEPVQRNVSIPKQMNLISSELILASAVKNGNLDKLESFQDETFPLAALQKMIKVQPSDKERESDSINITCECPFAKDCRVILEQVYSSYVSVLEEDNATAGKESVMLLEKVQEQLKSDQDISSQRYLQLVKKLNLSAENERGSWINPYSDDIRRVKVEREEAATELRDTTVLVDQVRAAMEQEANRPELFRLAVMDAKKFFQMTQQQSDDFDLSFADAETRNSASRFKQRLEGIEANLLEAEARKSNLLKSLGAQHSTVLRLDTEIETLREQQAGTKAALEDLYASVESSLATAQTTQGSQEAKRQREKENELVRLYATDLVRLQSKYKAAVNELSQKATLLEEEASIIAGDMAELNVLKERIEDRRAAITQLLEKLSAINIVSSNFNSTKVRLIDNASIGKQVAPILLKYLALGILAGVVLGSGLAVLIDQSDLSYRTPIDIHHNLRAPVICKVPNIKRGKPDPSFIGSPMLVAASRPNSPAAETFRAARTAIMFAAQKTDGRVFLFTSPSPGDGKSTTTCNLAVSLAQSGKKVVLVDADYRRPRVQQYFGVQFEPGSVDYLEGKVTLDVALRSTEIQSNLFILTTGGRPKNPGEIVSGNDFHNMIAALREKFDYVLIDSPPVLPVADATAIASRVDGIFLILRIRRGVMLASRKAKEQLDMVHGNVLGVIVNGMDENVYYNEYGYYYRGAYYSGSTRYYDAVNSDYSEKASAST
jgi:capsular exopolysaccharide synthesis family protein